MVSSSARRSSAGRILLFILGGIVILLLVAAALVAWALNTESGARTLLPMLMARTEGAVSVDGVHGSLAGPLRIERMVVERTNERIVLTDVRLEWQMRSLLQRRLLHVNALRAGHMTVISRVDQTPEPDTGLPEDLRLPLDLQVDEVRLGGGEIRRGPVTVAELAPIAFSLSYSDAQYRFNLRQFGATPELNEGSAAAGLKGTLDLSAQRPFPLNGRFEVDTQATLDEREIGADGTVTLDGSLEELRAGLDFTVNEVPLTGHTVLRPFSDRILGESRLNTEALDLAEVDAELPRTALDVSLKADKDGAGQLRVRNALPGTVDEQRVPLSLLEVAFQERDDGFYFDRILARLGSSANPKRSAGELRGSGSYVNGALTLDLRTEKLDLARIDPSIRATSLAGRLEATHENGRQVFTLALSEPLGKSRVTLDAHGVLADAELELRRAEIQAGEGRLRVAGRASLEGTQSFQAEGDLSRFRPHDFGRFEQIPEMSLNGKFSVKGAREPELQADLDFDISDSRLAGQPLTGSGKARLRGERLEVPRLLLASGANRLTAQGQLADGDANLNFSIQAPELGQLGREFGGAIFAEGVARGSLNQPHVTAEWRAERARLPGDVRMQSMQGQADVRLDRDAPFMLRTAEASLNATGLRNAEQQVDKLDARIRFSPQPDAPLALQIDAQGVTAGPTTFDSIVANVDGSTARHVVSADLAEQGQQWSMRASGGVDSLSADARWEGRIDKFEASGRIDARMTEPAPLLLSADRTRLEQLQLNIEGGSLLLDRFERNADGIETRGRIQQLEVAQLLQYADEAPPLRTDLQLSGEWDLRYTDTLDGSFSLRRESGDITMLGSAPVTLGLRTLRANLDAQDGQLALNLQADGERLGTIALEANTRLGNAESPLAIDRDAPLSGNARINIPSLAWAAPLVSPVMVADGRLQGNVRLRGTLGEPDVTGSITGDDLRVAHAEYGLDLRDGTLRSEFNEDRLQIQALTFSGPQGNVRISGPIDLTEDGVVARLLLRADRFAVLNRPDRRMVVSGESRLTWKNERAMITGDFTVNSGFFDVGQADRPRLGEDVVIVGKKDRQAGGIAAAIDVTVRIGEDVVVQGRGLDAQLAGQVRLLSDVGEPPQAEGSLRVAKGTFSAYGRELAIEQGVLRFTGPLDNPALDVLAMRRGQEVEAGVSVRGTVLEPRITLVSEPTVPDAEKLSWLVIGRSLASAGEAEIGSLQNAAASLLTQGAAAGVQSRIASAFGLDTFSVGTTEDTLRDRIVTIGKQISSRLYLGYEHGLDSAASVVQLRYLLTPTLSIEVEAGARSALSLFYNITFD